MAKLQSLLFPTSDGLKEAIDSYCKENKIKRPELIRAAIAEYIKYDITTDVQLVQHKTGRPSKYATKEKAAEAAREKRRNRADAVKQIVNAYKQGKRQEDIVAMLRSLGVKLD